MEDGPDGAKLEGEGAKGAWSFLGGGESTSKGERKSKKGGKVTKSIKDELNTSSTKKWKRSNSQVEIDDDDSDSQYDIFIVSNFILYLNYLKGFYTIVTVNMLSLK